MALKRAASFTLQSRQVKKVCPEGASSSAGKHRVPGFDSRSQRSKDFPSVVYSEGEGMYCSLCQKWTRRLPGRGNVWIIAPSVVLRRDSHVRSRSHYTAATAEQKAIQAKLKGGIAQAFALHREMLLLMH